MVRIKICGMTRMEDALLAAELGVDAVGFIFYPKSPRAITPETAKEIASNLPPFIARVGVFVDEPPDTVHKICEKVGLDSVQLHGSEPPEKMSLYPGRVIKAFRVRGRATLNLLPKYQVSAWLLDTYKKGSAGGTGETFDWDIAVEAKRHGRIILAGGLTPENIAEAVSAVDPYAVDVSSGVEKKPGVKDHSRMREFVERCHRSSTVGRPWLL